ncbi:MAG: VOC family protein [Anaerolineales bacterium]|jgi:predicted enzyme related to lactoylglutathione lyase
MSIHARYVHTNLIAHDWQGLAAFYQDVFGCIPVPPERNLRGEWLERATGLEGAHLKGIHLRLPGWGTDGPTLEIFQYSDMPDPGERTPNRPGLAHLAFSVENLDEAVRRVLEAGGGQVGEIVRLPIEGAGTVAFAYVTDPEGNIIELQRWEY